MLFHGPGQQTRRPFSLPPRPPLRLFGLRGASTVCTARMNFDLDKNIRKFIHYVVAIFRIPSDGTLRPFVSTDNEDTIRRNDTKRRKTDLLIGKKY